MNKYTLQYSLLMLFYWANFAVLCSYSSAYLLAYGLSNTAIGLLLALSFLLASFLQIVVSNYSDKADSPSLKSILMIIVLICIAASLVMLIFGKTSKVILSITFTAALTLLQVMQPLTNSLGINASSSGQNIDFGFGRGMGSLGFAITSLIVGKLLISAGERTIPAAAIILFVLFAVFLYLFPFNSTSLERKKQDSSDFVKKYPNVMIVIAAVFLLYIGHNSISNFMYQIVLSKGGDSSSQGIMLAIGAMVEIPVMILFSKLLKLLSIGKWLIFCSVFYVIKDSLTLAVTGVTGLYFAQAMQMFTLPILYVASVYYINQMVAREDSTKGQAWLSTANTASVVLASAFGGKLMDAFSVNSLLIVCIAAAVLGMLIMFWGIGANKKRPESNH